MNAHTRLAVFAAVLVAAFGGGWGIGQAWPGDGTRTPTDHEMPHDSIPADTVPTTHDMANMP